MTRSIPLRTFPVLLRLALALCTLSATAATAATPSDCAPCHPAQTAAHAQSGMARALLSPRTPSLRKQLGPWSYEITGSAYSVTDGKETLRLNLPWAFGEGSTGQTFLFQRESRWYESRVSYFPGIHALDLTLGMEDIKPTTLTEAAGRLISPAELTLCFGCHATLHSKTDPTGPNLIPGVQCERCHGDAAQHLATQSPLRPLGKMTTEEMSDFCGQCHRTWSDISLNGPRGIRNVRFQPYRIATARCYDPTDARIRCTACHEPHHTRETSPQAYDAKCAACHARTALGTTASRHICKIGTKNCVTCHMPNLELPGAHKKFSDHRIRIVRANATYPD